MPAQRQHRRTVALTLGVLLLLSIAVPAYGAKPSPELDLAYDKTTNAVQCMATLDATWAGANGKYVNLVWSKKIDDSEFYEIPGQRRTLNDGADRLLDGQNFGSQVTYRVEIVKGKSRVIASAETTITCADTG
jgi:hypothetical protein